MKRKTFIYEPGTFNEESNERIMSYLKKNDIKISKSNSGSGGGD